MANGNGKDPKRYTTKEPQAGITKASLRRLARRGGVKRINADVYVEVHRDHDEFIERILADAIQYTLHARRKTIMPQDIMFSLKRNNATVYF